MQNTLIQRYLGNKSLIVKDIVAVISMVAQPGDLVFDAFSGTLAVSAALRSANFRVACNDINYFSWIYANGYFSSGQRPWPNHRGKSAGRPNKEAAWEAALSELTLPYGKDIPGRFRRSDIFDHYCEAGSKSSFRSTRGMSGRRRFFSPENAVLIDRALSRIRYWYVTNVINERTRCILTACLLTAIEKVSNTQGTYHDFPRAFIDKRALNCLRLRVPPKEAFIGRPSRYIGKAQDTLEFAQSVPRHKVLYIDPPYNFRQYTSYYFMLNLISMYPEIADLDGFFSRIEFVRGQNMDSDFKSTFCSKASFIPSLETLVRRSNADYVVMSYFNGRNHWGQFKTARSDRVGRQMLEKFFNSNLFESRSLQCFPVIRNNYQSYGGHKAKKVEEFIFVAKKKIFARGRTSPSDERTIRRAVA